MEQQNYLIDTNAVIDFLGRNLPAKGMNLIGGLVDTGPLISVISKIEVLAFNTTEQHIQLLVNFMNDAFRIELTSDIVDVTINIRKKYKTKLPDAIIAATAIVKELTLISRNFSDFKNIEGINVIDPHKI